MTVSARKVRQERPVWEMAPALQRLGARPGERPRLQPGWPCLQQDQAAPEEIRHALVAEIAAMNHVLPFEPLHGAPGDSFALEDDVARGQPEAFIGAPRFVHVRQDGSLHLGLRPEWAQKVVNRGWAAVHPFARYMAGAVPPQSLVVFAPRNSAEIRVILRVVEAARGYAMGRIGQIILPDTRW